MFEHRNLIFLNYEIYIYMQKYFYRATMNIYSLFRTTCQTIKFMAPKLSSMEPFTKIIHRNMHHICDKQYSNNLSNMYMNKISSILLQPSLPMYNVICGLKMKTILKRRCKHCLLMWRNDRAYIKCKVKPKHNQVERKKKEYKTWILTHASQSKVREW